MPYALLVLAQGGLCGDVRLAEFVASLSLATDLGRGQSMEHTIRETLIALRLAELVGLDEDDRTALYYVGLLYDVYCHADAHEQAKWFGDDIALKESASEADIASVGFKLTLLPRLGSGETGLARLRRVADFPVRGWKEMNGFLRTHARLASEFAAKLGLPRTVSVALEQCYERWDGDGAPNGDRGDEITLASRILSLADVVDVYYQSGGAEAARRAATKRSGGQLDPGLVEVFLDHADDLLAEVETASCWNAVIGAEPGLARTVREDELDDVLAATADLVDMKSPYTAGHSRGVGNLAAEAASVSAMSREDVVALRRAGYVHDLGRLGISNAIWEKKGPLSAAELERVRLHPYLSDRMLAGLPALRRIRLLAARNHERLDGSGYPAGLSAADLSPTDRVLAAADVYHAMSEPRAYRDALPPATAVAEMRAEVKAGRLDGDAVNAVLRAEGHRTPARREWPAGLTAREVEVLGLLARGCQNKEIASRLVVTPKTVSTHVEHIYSKLDVSSRAGATLYATQHGLVGSFEAN
jgi:HD-GYP domain-containing protein (c-di-GMP phosphodiesterase class II)